MEYTSRMVRVRDPATDLTGSTVYASSVPIRSGDRHELLVEYDPDTDSTNALEVVVQVSWDDDSVTDANSTWVQIGEIASSSGTLTFTARLLSMASGAAATQAHWSFDVQGKKLRVGVSETNTPADFGNAEIWLFSRSSG